MSTLNVTNIAGPSNTGTTAVLSSVNGGQIGGARNRIINGDMRIDQRNDGEAVTVTAGAALAYTIDRWYTFCTGANLYADIRTPGSGTASPYQTRFRLNSAASVTSVGVGQRIEAANCVDLGEQTVTLSAHMNSSLQLPVTWTVYYANTINAFGTLASPTRTQIATGTWNTTTLYKAFSASFTVPEIAGYKGLEIVFTIGALTSGSWEIGQVQLEAGTIATPFERRSYGQELALCQRYYESSYSNGVSAGTVTNDGAASIRRSVASETLTVFNETFKVPKRTVPTVVWYSPSDGASGKIYNVSSSNITVTGTSTDVPTSETKLGAPTHAANGSAGQVILGHWTASSEL